MTMLPQILCGLRQLHSFGYSHGDLKGENICARADSNGHFKFTLIDLGICTKLPKMGKNAHVTNFKGNLMFASANQIKNNRPNEIDDVYSLFCVAYRFLVGSLPWMEFMRKLKEQSGFIFESDVKEKEFYSSLRQKQEKKFDDELIITGEHLTPFFKVIRE